MRDYLLMLRFSTLVFNLFGSQTPKRKERKHLPSVRRFAQLIQLTARSDSARYSSYLPFIVVSSESTTEVYEEISVRGLMRGSTSMEIYVDVKHVLQHFLSEPILNHRKANGINMHLLQGARTLTTARGGGQLADGCDHRRRAPAVFYRENKWI